MSIKTMSRVWEQSEAKGSDLLLLLAIADFSDDNGFAFPGIDTLATKIRMTAQSVRNITTRLMTSGELIKISRTDVGRSNLYIVMVGLSDEMLQAARDKAESFGGGQIVLPPSCALGGGQIAILGGGKVAVVGGGQTAIVPDPSVKPSSTPSVKQNIPEKSENAESAEEPSQLNTFFPRDEPVQEGAQVQPAGLPPPGTDIVGAMYHFSTRQQPDNWAVPAEAGGADDWAPAWQAFARYVGIQPDLLPESQQKEWSKTLKEIAAPWKVGPMIITSVIGKVPESQFAWKSWATPHQAKDDLSVLIGQHLSGGIQKPAPKNGTKRPTVPVDRKREEEEFDYANSQQW